MIDTVKDLHTVDRIVVIFVIDQYTFLQSDNFGCITDVNHTENVVGDVNNPQWSEGTLTGLPSLTSKRHC
jgi:hypothetical protein